MRSVVRLSLAAALAGALAAPALAAVRTVTLSVPGMTCPVCPITVHKALAAVPGVDKVDVNYDKKDAVVRYDDARTNVQALVKATTDAGYPSQPMESAQ